MKIYLTYKNQIQGFKDVLKTIKTVEKVAASSIHFLEQKVLNLNIYANEIEEILSELSAFYSVKNNPFLQKKTSGKKSIVILTGDKGLVGGLWHKIINSFLEDINKNQSVIVIGEKSKDYLQEENIQIVKSFILSESSKKQKKKLEPIDELGIFKKEEIEYITDYIFNQFKNGTFSQVDILYPKFISLANQQAFLISFLPFNFTSNFLNNTSEKDKDITFHLNKRYQKNDEFKLLGNKVTKNGLPIFEPSKRKIFNQLLQKYIKVFFYKIIMETKLSELSARTVAMEHSAKKTKEFIKKSTLYYAKNRRRIVTQRQLESFIAHKIV